MKCQQLFQKPLPCRCLLSVPVLSPLNNLEINNEATGERLKSHLASSPWHSLKYPQKQKEKPAHSESKDLGVTSEFNFSICCFLVVSLGSGYLTSSCFHSGNSNICLIEGTSQVSLVAKNLPANAGDARDISVSWSLGGEDPPGEGNGNTLPYSCLENLMDRGAWRAAVHVVAKSWTWLTEQKKGPYRGSEWADYNYKLSKQDKC